MHKFTLFSVAWRLNTLRFLILLLKSLVAKLLLKVCSFNISFSLNWFLTCHKRHSSFRQHIHVTSVNSIFRSSRSHIFFKIDVLKNSDNCTGKHLRWSLFLINFFSKMRLQHKRFLAKFTKYLRTPFLKENLRWLLLYFSVFQQSFNNGQHFLVCQKRTGYFLRIICSLSIQNISSWNSNILIGTYFSVYKENVPFMLGKSLLSSPTKINGLFKSVASDNIELVISI